MQINTISALIVITTLIFNIGLAAAGVQKVVTCTMGDTAAQAASAASAWVR